MAGNSESVVVRIRGRGTVTKDGPTADASQEATCDLCGTACDAVASVGVDGAGPFACKDCLRGRLEAMTIASWQLRDAKANGPESGLPWGKVSG